LKNELIRVYLRTSASRCSLKSVSQVPGISFSAFYIPHKGAQKIYAGT